MFVRAVWRIRRPLELKHALRELELPMARNGDTIGLSGVDFAKMTRGLFDR